MNTDAAETLASEINELNHLAADLSEAYESLDRLCSQLEGGGIVQARDVEPTIARTVPKLRRAVAVLKAVAVIGEARQKKSEPATPKHGPTN